MKTKTIFKELSHDDLVELLSSASYSSDWFGILMDGYNAYKKDGDCMEDVWARCLLDGQPIWFCDYYADDRDAFYGTLEHEYNDRAQCMKYRVTLNDIIRGLQNAIDSGNAYARKCVHEYINYDDCGFDQTHAKEIVQWIMFGESIYG